MSANETYFEPPTVIELEPTLGEKPPANRRRIVDGATFVNDVPESVPSLWGDDSGIAWASGEGLKIVGPDGVGKTALAQQLLLHRIGVRRGPLLGMEVEPIGGRALYIAADRPRQAASSLRRMVHPADEKTLANHLVVWKGPLEFDIAKEPRQLRQFVESIGFVEDVYIDSLKDIASDLVKDEVGSRVNIAYQELIASEYELVVLHHQRKEQQQAAKPKRLTDVYGSRWLTAGMGSVVLLWGEPGDLVVEFKHLKQPAGDLGSFNIAHDHERGVSDVHQRVDLVHVLGNAAHGLTVADAAQLLSETSTPDRNEIEKARRRLNKLTNVGRATRRDDPDGLARYFDPEKTA